LGKQINYWMDYENFILLAEKALELGCIIYRRRADEQGKIVYGNDISIVTANVSDYYFYFPQAGKIVIDIINGRECISTIHDSGQAIIEAGFSIIHQEKKKITRSRLWCSSGFYREDGEYINRSEDLTKVYNSLARYVKKLAPYTELVDVYISSRDKDYGKEVEYKHKEYVSRYCIDKMSEGYKLVASLWEVCGWLFCQILLEENKTIENWELKAL